MLTVVTGPDPKPAMVRARTGVLVGLLAALVLGGAGQLPAAGAARKVDRASIILDAPSPPSPYEDTPTRLTGRLTGHRPDRLVIIQQRVSMHWQPVGRTRTDNDGEFRLSLTPVDPGTVVLRAVHPAHEHRLESMPQRLDVLDRRVFVATKPSYQTLHDIVLTGTVRPRSPHEYVALQRRVGDRWLPVHGGYTNSDGGYAISMPDNRPGGWTVRTYWPGARPGHGTREYSYSHHYVVRATLDPEVTRVTREQLGGSYHAGCPVGPALLRNVAMTYRTFGPFVDRGTLVVRATIVDKMSQVFGRALSHGYPVRRMFPTARYGGSDVRSMNHDNTSAFNCRNVTGDPTRLSPHSYGTALDIDTVENPYQDVTGTWWPKNIGQRYRDRRHAHPGMLYAGSRVTRDLNARGFRWGGRWSHPDYQHFDTGSDKAGAGGSARRSGPLTAASMPPRSALGSGWKRLADPGGTAGGGPGNGSFVHAREARDAAVGVQPLGCAGHYHPPVGTPRWALQGGYLSDDHRLGQAVVMQFATARQAASFFAELQGALRSCVAADGPAGLVVRGGAGDSSSYSGWRRYGAGERWREHDWREGSRVTILLTQASQAS